MEIKTIKVNEYNKYQVKQIIDIAGFSSKIDEDHSRVILIDKRYPDAEKYSDPLTFRTLQEAVAAIYNYILALHYEIIF